MAQLFQTPALNLVHCLLRQMRSCGPCYVLRKFIAVIFRQQYRIHAEISLVLSRPEIQAVFQHQPKSAFKYLRKYLAKPFSLQQRAQILSYHYQFLSLHINNHCLERVCRDSITLWQHQSREHLHEIRLSHPQNEEGEFLLSVRMGGKVIFTLAFTIAPGNLLGLIHGPVIFIGRSQGTAGEKVAIKHTTKLFHEISPAFMLLDTVRAIAAGLNIHRIVDVSASNQICLPNTDQNKVTSVYDDLWQAAGGVLMENKVGYCLPARRKGKTA